MSRSASRTDTAALMMLLLTEVVSKLMSRPAPPAVT